MRDVIEAGVELVKLLEQVLCLSGGEKSSVLANEQLVADRFLQVLKRSANGRLGNVEHDGGLGRRASRHHGAERIELLQVELQYLLH